MDRSGYIPTVTTIDEFSKHNMQFNSRGGGLSVRAPSNAFLERLDMLAQGYFYILTASLYVAIIYYSKDVYTTNSSYVNYFVTYVLFNILANYYFCSRYGAVYKPLEANDLPDDMWTFCNYCQQKQPPRVHHCPLCHKCIVKRDHHCFFIATCIGQRNQAYFTIFCFHVVIGFYFGFQVLSHILSNTYYELYSWDFYHYIPPVTLFELLLQRIDVLTFLSVILMCGSWVTGIFTALLFVWQCLLISCDMTTHDAQVAWMKGGVVWSKLRPWYNIKAALGPLPFLPFLFPVPMFSSKSFYSIQHGKPFL